MWESAEIMKFIEECDSYSFDPTFPCSKNDGYQLGVLMAHKKNPDLTRTDNSLPVCYTYMQNKTREAYVEFFSAFKSKMGNGVMRLITIDMEHAIRNGLENMFGNTKIKYCTWHWLQAINSYVPGHFSKLTLPVMGF